MAINADTGNGATLTIGTFSARLTRIDIGEETRDKLDNSDLSTTGFMKYAEGDLVDPGEIEVDYIFRSDEASDVPEFDEPATLTITFPMFPGSTTPASLAGTAILVQRKKPELVNNQMQAGAARWAWDGETGPTYTPAT